MASLNRSFDTDTRRALGDAKLQGALEKLSHSFPVKRQETIDRLPEFEDLRAAAREIKEHVLENLDFYLEQFESRVVEQGGQVHWCRDAAEARDAVLRICQDAGARTVTKSKSMISEEIAVAAHLEEHGITPVETDLGEYIIQLRREPPSHIIVPAIHLSKEQIAETFKENHGQFPADRSLGDPRALLEEARGVLRRRFLEADVGITGANMLVAETGSVAIVTNEGNADLTMCLPRTQIVIASLEKVVPTLEDAATILRILARSATGQDMSVYTTFATGPRRSEDPDGPEAFHVVLLDAGRSDMLGNDFHDMLRCIRCGACLNHCPVYAAIGGHAYGWIYSGPMGAVLMPGLIGLEKTGDLPNASTLCGKCQEICPMAIPLPRMLRHWRRLQFEQKKIPVPARLGLKAWAFLAKRPALYNRVMSLIVRTMGFLGRGRGCFKWLPLSGGWTSERDFPVPEGRTFKDRWGKK
jgi:L-lactate dehydrogenase complex protein LldF